MSSTTSHHFGYDSLGRCQVLGSRQLMQGLLALELGRAAFFHHRSTDTDWLHQLGLGLVLLEDSDADRGHIHLEEEVAKG